MTRQQYSFSFRWQPTNDLTSPPVDLWGQGRDAELVLGVAGGRDAGTSGMGAVPLRLAQMIGQQKKPHKKKKKKKKGKREGRGGGFSLSLQHG